MAAENKQSFWNHLDVLRAAIVKITLVTVGFGVVAFFFKEQLFSVVLAPKSDGFITYRLFNRIAAWGGGLSEPFSVQLINTGLAQQFVIHMKTALCAGVLCASPYILAHNHPSGNMVASSSDNAITSKLKKACEILDITLLDHIILSDTGYLSYADEGML